MISKLNELFPLRYCINLDSRKDRWSFAELEFPKIHTTVQRFSGMQLEDEPSFVGCGLSHFSLLQYAWTEAKNLLVFEDDVMFINDYENIIPNALNDLPEDWDMIFFGGNICDKIYQKTPFLGKLSHIQSTHAYGINKIFIHDVLSRYNDVYSTPMDLIYSSLVKANNFYITIPMVAVQRSGYSDIERKVVDYSSWMEKRFYDQLELLR